MTKVMISLEKVVLDNLWRSRRTDTDSWDQIVERLLEAARATARRSVEPVQTKGSCEVEVLGKKHCCAKAIDGLVWCLETLAQLDCQLIDKVASAVKSRSRNHIARSKLEVYPDRADLTDSARPISGGWYVGSNISNRDKLRIVQQACKVAGLKFGTDVKWVVARLPTR